MKVALKIIVLSAGKLRLYGSQNQEGYACLGQKKEKAQILCAFP
jgi:hypothetical protein